MKLVRLYIDVIRKNVIKNNVLDEGALIVLLVVESLDITEGLKLSYEDSEILIKAAGFYFAPGEEFDNVIITYLQNNDYDVNDVNLSLAERKVPESLFLLQKNRKSPDD